MNEGAAAPGPARGSILIALMAALMLAAPATVVAAPVPANSVPRPGAIQGDSAGAAEPGGGFSDAELLIRTHRIIVQDQNRRRLLESHSDELAREFEAVSKRFERLDAELKADAQAGSSPAERKALEQRWALARVQLDPLLQRRQAMDQQIKILKQKIEREKEALDLLSAGQALPSLPRPVPAPPAPGPADATAPGPSPGGTLPGSPRVGIPVPESGIVPRKPIAHVPTYDRRVAEAERKLLRRENELRLAENRAQLVDQLTSLNQDDLSQARALAETSRGLETLLDEQLAGLERDLSPQQGAVPGRLGIEREGTAAETRRLAAAAATTAAGDAEEVAALEYRDSVLKVVGVLQEERVAEAERGVEAARRELEFLQSPLAPHRVGRWLLGAAPRVAAILMLLALLWLGARSLTRRLIRRMVHLRRQGSEEGRVERIETLRRAMQSVLSIGFVVAGALAVLPEFGVDITVLVGGAAVFSLAIAFGAQSLVKDYFSGFMILMEDQYRVGNVVQINDKRGVVEDVSLRMTKLRDLEGVAHLVPHGQIATVSNMTHLWSQVVLDIGVAYKENVDHVMRVLMELARELRGDPQFGPLILDEPEMLGVDALADSAVVIKIVVRTRPSKQWTVKRELLRRIKNRFDELGIEIPFPHRTLFHRGLEPPLLEQLSKGSAEASAKDQGETG